MEVWYNVEKCRRGKKMSYIRKIRVEYYQVVKAYENSQKSSKEKLFDLEALLLKADQSTLENRTFEYYQEEARLDKMKFNTVDNYWYLNFIRLRQTKIPSKARKNEEAEPLTLLDDEYIGEDVTAIYDVKNHILALQRNRDSLSASGIEDYLSKLLGVEGEEICLHPIAPLNIQEKLNKAKIYRKITMKFANIPTSCFKGDKNSSFGKLLDYFSNFSANCATLTISLGHIKRGSLDCDMVKETLPLLLDNVGLISGAEVNVKKTEVDPVDTIDLFSMKSHDFITIKLEKLETIKFEDMAEEIHAKYNVSKESLLRALNS